MKRVATGAHLPLFGFWNLRNTETIQPTTAWAALPSPSASTMYLFSQLSELGRALWVNSCGGSDQCAFKANWAI